MRYTKLLLAGALLLAACSSGNKPEAEVKATPAAAVAAPAPVASAPVAAPVPTPAAVGFDLSTVPVVTPKLGAFPYFTLLDGYHKGTIKDPEVRLEEAKDLIKEVAFDRYEVFDGVKIIPVEGRLTTTKAVGSGASFFQVQKTYEKLVHDLGGVTV